MSQDEEARSHDRTQERTINNVLALNIVLDVFTEASQNYFGISGLSNTVSGIVVS